MIENEPDRRLADRRAGPRVDRRVEPLPPAYPDRVVHAEAHLQAAAEAYWAAGDYALVAQLLRPVIPSTADPVASAEMATVLGQAELWLAGPTTAIRRYDQHAIEVAEIRPDITAVLFVHAATAALLMLDSPAALDRAQRAADAASRTDDAGLRALTSALHRLTELFAGSGRAATDLGSILQLAVHARSQGARAADDLTLWCGYGLIACERWADATELLGAMVSSAPPGQLRPGVTLAHLLLAEVSWRTGSWRDSHRALTRLLAEQVRSDPGHTAAGTLAYLARVEAGLGRAAECRAHARQALQEAADGRFDLFAAVSLSAVGLLELAEGRFAEAGRAFDGVSSKAGHLADSGWLWWATDAVEAYLAAGRAEDAHDVAERLRAQAQVSGRNWARHADARAQSLLAGRDAAEQDLGRAADGFAAVGAPFDQARALLHRGAQRWHRGHQAEGGRDLAAARSLFERVGARAWSERAEQVRTEPAPSTPSLASMLTDAEMRVASVVGHGASNREAAAELFISVKTVDYHLQNIYRKLGLRSRTQLAALVLSDAGVG